MRCNKLWAVFILALTLGGCASTPGSRTLALDVWQDRAFNYDPALVPETQSMLFALDAEVQQNLASVERLGYTAERRLDLLMSRLYGPAGIRLAYNAGQTTMASQTWHNKRGDCLSLTILAYAAAKSLGLSAHMQEVRVPVTLDRRNGVDFINGHVNVYVRNLTDLYINGQFIQSGGFVIDFQPQAGSRGTGVWLTEESILARYYNNRGSEFLVQADDARAYAYYRAAIAADPSYAPTYANLALLYSRRGLLPGAEQLLLYAIGLGGTSYAPLRTMQLLLTAQGRVTEAKYYADLLLRRQDEDPYYWLGLGLDALNGGRNAAAIGALERAAALTTGFEEIHFNLALAYWRSGQAKAAEKQLAALRAINSQDPGVAVLAKKLQAVAPS